jgi:hypothetical protein
LVGSGLSDDASGYTKVYQHLRQQVEKHMPESLEKNADLEIASEEICSRCARSRGASEMANNKSRKAHFPRKIERGPCKTNTDPSTTGEKNPPRSATPATIARTCQLRYDMKGSMYRDVHEVNGVADYESPNPKLRSFRDFRYFNSPAACR